MIWLILSEIKPGINFSNIYLDYDTTMTKFVVVVFYHIIYKKKKLSIKRCTCPD